MARSDPGAAYGPREVEWPKVNAEVEGGRSAAAGVRAMGEGGSEHSKAEVEPQRDWLFPDHSSRWNLVEVTLRDQWETMKTGW